MEFLLALTTLSLLPLRAHAHMQMSNPYPINSPLNPATPESLKDYSYTSPLLADGSNFPCKGYQTQSTSYNTTATYTAGSTYSVSITGATNHGGGSCQLSLSYDNGQTFKVIESMIGGCPITTTYNFTIPSLAPSSQSALFAWSWFNEMGNREMYMDCARVEIQAVSPGRHRRAQYKRQASLSSLPDLFVCNVNNGCTTIERENVQFPDPGANVIYGADDSAYLSLNGTGFTGSGYASNNTVVNITMPSATTTSGPDANTTSTVAPLFFPNTATSLLSLSSTTAAAAAAAAAAIQSTSTLILVDVFTVATTLLVNRTPSSLLVSATNISSSAVMPMATVLTTAGSSATSSSYQSIFSNTTSSSSRPSPSSQLPPFSNTTLILSSQLTTLPASTMTVPTSNSTFVIVTSTSASASASASATLLTGPCISGAFACNSASTFSQCAAGLGGTSSYTYMGSVAAGMECSNGQIIRQNDGPCTPNGQLFCNGEYAFYTCDQGGLVNMGPVAPGTACVNGVIGYLRQRM